MGAERTPNFPGHDDIDDAAPRFVEVDFLNWQPTPFPGVEIKILIENPETGAHTSLTRMAPGAVLPMHEHMGLEQSFVLEGSLVDDQGAVTAGNFVWRPAGSVHTAHSPDGCLVLGIFRQPNRFLE
jgi:anti-sigma factor ChrR (cupin superfamily)